jgi:hypothetical protein
MRRRLSSRRYDSRGQYVPVRNRLPRRRRLSHRTTRHQQSRAFVYDPEYERRKEEARLHQPWRCINGDGRPRAGTAKRFRDRSKYCTECLASHKRRLDAARARVYRQKKRTKPTQ